MKRSRALIASGEEEEGKRYRNALTGHPFHLTTIFDWDSPDGRLVGARLQHWWILDQAWFGGRVIRFDSKRGEYLVKYDGDNEELWISIQQEAILIGSEVITLRYSILFSLII